MCRFCKIEQLKINGINNVNDKQREGYIATTMANGNYTKIVMIVDNFFNEYGTRTTTTKSTHITRVRQK